LVELSARLRELVYDRTTNTVRFALPEAEAAAALAAVRDEATRRADAVIEAARAYREAETDGTPRMWRGKALQDLTNRLDEALDALSSGAGGGGIMARPPKAETGCMSTKKPTELPRSAE